MKKTLFITMLAAALLGGNVFANTGFEGGTMLGSTNVLSENGNLVIFEDAQSQYTELGDVYGSFQGSPVSTNATVTIHGGIVQGAYGAFSLSDVAEGKVKMTGGIVRLDVYGGCATDESCNATKNTVIVSGGSVGRTIYGGYEGGESLTGVSSNRVYITGLSAGCAPNVIGGLAAAIGEASAGGNQVHLVGDGAQILIDNELYQGHAVTLGKVIGGQANGYVMGNSIDIYGSGISAKSVQYLQSLNFHLVDGLATAEAPMLTLSGTDQSWHKFNMAEFSLGIIADDVTDWGVLAGHTVTLVESQLAITGFGSTPYKVVDVTKTGQSASKGILTLGNEGKELLLKVLRPGTEVLAPGESRQAGSAAITALKENEPGLLDNLTLDTDTILGAGRAASLADGLKIQSDANLMIKNMTITANNEIHVGDNTITLKDVTIKISDDVCTLVNGIYTIDLRNLINCDLEMQNVLLDASDLTLPEGFDPANKSVVFDFGDDVTIRQATGLDMRLGNYWSPSLNLDQQGQVIFTKLVETPEPTTGTLSLLALAALAARRRK